MEKIQQKGGSKPQNMEDIDEIFEKELRPLQSHNSRHIFMVLRDAYTEYLTTYDMQSILEEQGNKLNKVELNNWLSTLQEAGIVLKSLKRGKPTTKPYTKRYTFDLWKLTTKGREISNRLQIFIDKKPSLSDEENINNIKKSKLSELEKIDFTDHEKIFDLSITLTLLKTLKEEQIMDLKKLSKQTGFTIEKIYESVKNHEKKTSSPLYCLSESDTDLREKILKTIGLSQKQNYIITLSPEGVKIISKSSP